MAHNSRQIWTIKVTLHQDRREVELRHARPAV